MSNEEKILDKLEALQKEVSSLKADFRNFSQENKEPRGMTAARKARIMELLTEFHNLPDYDGEMKRFGEFMDAERARKEAMYG